MEELPPSLILIPITVLLASLAEAAVLAWRRPAAYDWRSTGLSLADLLGRNLMRYFLPLSFVAFAGNWIYQHRLFTIRLDSVSAFLLLFVGQEFFYYWYHRCAHRVRWFWATHSIHHSPNQLNLSAAYRLGWTGALTGAPFFFAPLILLGFQPTVVFSCLALNLLYQFWVHATWIPKLGLLEYVLNTPSAHRVHHASNIEYLDANYGGVLIVFDRLFGTYIEENTEVPCVYGWVKPITSNNLLQIEFSQWLSLARDVLHAPSPGAAIGYLVKPPGWSPDGKGQTTEDLRGAAGGAMAIDLKLAPAEPAL